MKMQVICRLWIFFLCRRYVASGPLVRSSYRAGEFFIEAMIKGDAAKH